MTAPRFSVITPVYNTQRRHLEECISSVLAQSFQDWELCLVDDHSSSRDVRSTLERAGKLDPRIRIKYRSVNGGIVAASNDALSMATGEFVVLLDHDDVIEPDALERVNATLKSDPEIDYVYSDETTISSTGRVDQRFYKPDWSPERFRHQMYVCHLSTIRRTVIEAVGGFREGFDGSQDYELIFRVMDEVRKIGHVRELLYHWRMTNTSVANNAAAKPYAYEAGKRAIESHLLRSGIGGRVTQLENVPGNYKTLRQPSSPWSVDVLVPLTDLHSDVWGVPRNHRETTLSSLQSTAHPDWSICPIDGMQHRASELNREISRSTADVIVLVSPAIEPLDNGWSLGLVEPLSDPSIGIVSGITYTANGRLEHAGFHLNRSFVERPYHRLPLTDWGPKAVLGTVYEVSAIDWQCMAIKRAVFEHLGGFDEELEHPWTVIDFCLRASLAGFSTVVNPWAKFFEFSNNDDFARPRFRAPKSFRQKWAGVFVNDPYRPTRPLRGSPESQRPFWQPQTFRDVTKSRRFASRD